MPRGRVTIDGREVSAVGPEYRAYLEAHPEARKVRTPKGVTPKGVTPKARAIKVPRPPAPKPNDPGADVLQGEPDGVEPGPSGGFTAGDPAPGRPKTPHGLRRSPHSPTRAAKARAGSADDAADLAELISGAYAALAAATGFETWRLSEAETGAIARPASRILGRHKQLDRAVRQIADPIALGAAVIVPTAIRANLYREYLLAKRGVGVSRPGHPGMATAPPPPPPPAPEQALTPTVNGATSNGKTASPIVMHELMKLHTQP